MHRADGRARQHFQHEITIRDAIERIGGGPVEAQRPGGLLAVDGEGGPRQGRSAQRAFIEAFAGVGEAAAVAAQHLRISQQVVAEGDGLGRLQMGEARHDRARMIERPLGERLLEAAHLNVEIVYGVADPEAEIHRHLIVTRARRVQTPRVRTDDFGQPGLDVHMDVFEGAGKDEGSRLDFRLNLV